MSPSLSTYLPVPTYFLDQVCKEKERKKRGRDVPGGVDNENENERN